MSTSQCNCGYHAADNTGSYNIKAPEENTLERMAGNIRILEKSINRLEIAIDKLDAGDSVELVLKPEPPWNTTSVANVWKTAPSKINESSEKIHKLIDRLEEIFR